MCEHSVSTGCGTLSPCEVSHARANFILNMENVSVRVGDCRWWGEALLTSQSSRDVGPPCESEADLERKFHSQQQLCSWACGNNQPMETSCFQDVCFH